MINNLIIIPLQINDSDSLFFILDTGVKNTIITELHTDDSITLNYTRKVRLQGLGNKKYVEAYQSVHNYCRLMSADNNKKIECDNLSLYVLNDTTLKFTRFFGTRINGIIGSDLFKNFVVQINYPQHELIFYNPDEYNYAKKRKRMNTYPLIINDSKPYLDCEITFKNGLSLPVNMLIDSGASFGIWLLPESDVNINLPEKLIETQIGYGLNGEIFGKIGRISKLKIGEFVLSNPIVSFPDSGSFILQSGTDDRNGTIGAEILRRFKIILDYPGKEISLKPNYNFRDKFNYNMSGIHVISPYPGLPFFVIDYIEPGSPADIAGISAGDQIFEINRESAVRLSLNDIYNIFIKSPGTTVILKVFRNGKRLYYKFKLKSVI